jgi:hypothetical protein
MIPYFKKKPRNNDEQSDFKLMMILQKQSEMIEKLSDRFGE